MEHWIAIRDAQKVTYQTATSVSCRPAISHQQGSPQRIHKGLRNMD